MKGSSRQGFTLIELLIVVAIIAILAAIAVPNFLEAQTRAKVARTKSDMRSLAVAIESYATDYGRAPIGRKQILDTDANPNGVPGWDTVAVEYRVYQQMTTPVAYLTFIPTDIFSINANRIGSNGARGGSNELMRLMSCDVYVLHSQTLTQKPMQVCLQRGVNWFAFSLGPQRRWGLNPNYATAHLAPNYPNDFYDPTNGTMSRGLIIRSSAGIEPTN